MQPSSGATCLIYVRTLRLLPYSMCANSEGSGETAWMSRLAWAFAGRLCDKYHNLMSWFKHQPDHEKMCHMQTTKVQISLCIRTDWSAPLLFTAYNTYTYYIQSFKTLASFCSWAGLFESYHIANPRGHIFHDMAHILESCLFYFNFALRYFCRHLQTETINIKSCFGHN